MRSLSHCKHKRSCLPRSRSTVNSKMPAWRRFNIHLFGSVITVKLLKYRLHRSIVSSLEPATYLRPWLYCLKLLVRWREIDDTLSEHQTAHPRTAHWLSHKRRAQQWTPRFSAALAPKLSPIHFLHRDFKHFFTTFMKYTKTNNSYKKMFLKMR